MKQWAKDIALGVAFLLSWLFLMWFVAGNANADGGDPPIVDGLVHWSDGTSAKVHPVELRTGDNLRRIPSSANHDDFYFALVDAIRSKQFVIWRYVLELVK